ncbi:MAG: hypothetical protein M3Y67_10005, partial [Pseudomonadota bacterium]|nr:hypothetical protein [Pseudomonadota bacterium]
AGAFIAVPLLLGLRAVSQRSKRLRLVRIYLDRDAADVQSVRSLLKLGRQPSPAPEPPSSKR